MKRVLIGLFLLGLGVFLIAQQPVQIQQGNNNAAVTASNALKVDGSAVTQPVSGTVAATQSTSPWVDSITTWASGTLGAMANYGTSPGAVLVPGVNAFITNIPTVTANAGTGTFNIQSNASVNLTQLNSVALGSPSNYGTSPGAVSVPGVNAFITNTPTVTANAGSGTFTVSGTITANQGTNPWTDQGALSNNGAAAATNRLGTLPGIVQTDPANGSAYTQGRDAAPNIDTAGNLWVSQFPGMRPASYHASLNFAASSTTDNACLYGNATNTLIVYDVEVSGIQATAGILNVQLIRRSTAETGGTTTNFDVSPDDTTNYAAASSTPVAYTSTGPTVGTKVGVIYQHYTGFLAATTATDDGIFAWNGKQKGELLIGTSQGLCINVGNAALTGGTMDVDFRWYQIKNISE